MSAFKSLRSVMEIKYDLLWNGWDEEKECKKENPSNSALWNLRVEKATLEWCLEKALQKEASDATYLSFWTSNVTDHAALCGF